MAKVTTKFSLFAKQLTAYKYLIGDNHVSELVFGGG